MIKAVSSSEKLTETVRADISKILAQNHQMDAGNPVRIVAKRKTHSGCRFKRVRNRCMRITIGYAIRSARPRVSSKLVSLDDVGSNRANILFFGHFSNMTEDDFVTGMSDLVMNQTALYQNMIRDIYGLGSVLQRKYSLLRTSYTMFMIALVLGISSFIAVYIWIVLTVDPLAVLISGLPVISIL